MSSPGGFDPAKPYRSSTSEPTWGASPYSQFAQPPKPSGSWGCWWMVLLLGVPLAGLVCCGLCGGVVHLGLELVEEEIVANLNRDPVIQEHLGEVKSAELDLWDSIREEIKNPTGEDEDSWYVFDVVGTKATGRVIGKSVANDSDVEELREGRLILADGTEVELSK